MHLIILFIILNLFNASAYSVEHADSISSDLVFICSGDYARTFHTDSLCSGLNACGQSIVSVKRSKVPLNTKLCKICSKNSTSSNRTQKIKKHKSKKNKALNRSSKRKNKIVHETSRDHIREAL